MEKYGALSTCNAFARPILSGTAELVYPVEVDKSLMVIVDAAAHQAQFSTAINVFSSRSTNAKLFKMHSGISANVFVCLVFPSKA